VELWGKGNAQIIGNIVVIDMNKIPDVNQPEESPASLTPTNGQILRTSQGNSRAIYRFTKLYLTVYSIARGYLQRRKSYRGIIGIPKYARHEIYTIPKHSYTDCSYSRN
jgi:hypothetical protein